MKGRSNEWRKDFKIVNKRVVWIRGKKEVKGGDFGGYVMDG